MFRWYEIISLSFLFITFEKHVSQPEPEPELVSRWGFTSVTLFSERNLETFNIICSAALLCKTNQFLLS
jgi:hypothetical protein